MGKTGAIVYRNGPNYQNGLPKWTFTSALEYDLWILLGPSGQGLPQKAISLRNMQFMYPKIRPCAEGW